MIGNLQKLNVPVVDSSMVRQVTAPQHDTVTRMRLGRADGSGPEQLRLGEELEQSSTGDRCCSTVVTLRPTGVTWRSPA